MTIYKSVFNTDHFKYRYFLPQAKVTIALTYAHKHKCLEDNLTGILHSYNKTVFSTAMGLSLLWNILPMKYALYPVESN